VPSSHSHKTFPISFFVPFIKENDIDTCQTKTFNNSFLFWICFEHYLSHESLLCERYVASMSCRSCLSSSSLSLIAFFSRQQFLFVAINNSSHWLAVKIKTLFTIQSQSKSVQVIFFVSFGFHYHLFDIFIEEKGNVLVSNASWVPLQRFKIASYHGFLRISSYNDGIRITCAVVHMLTSIY
jgi:hypothetical protein